MNRRMILKNLTEECIERYNLSLNKIIEKEKIKDFTLIFSKDNTGFITGYQDLEDKDCLFIWLYCVKKDYRGKGVGLKLLKNFEKMALNKGYKFIRTYTENRFKGKIIRSLKEGFDIKSFNSFTGRVLLEKEVKV